MHASYLDYLPLIPFILAIAFMLWFLWNVTVQLKRSRSPQHQTTIPIEVVTRYKLESPILRMRRLDIQSR